MVSLLGLTLVMGWTLRPTENHPSNGTYGLIAALVCFALIAYAVWTSKQESKEQREVSEELKAQG